MKTTNIILIILTILLIIGGVYTFSNKNTEKIDTQTVVTASTTTSTIIKNALYKAYTPENIKNLTGTTTVLFFKASWCPSCRVVDRDIKNRIDSIPEHITILEVDYDSSTELKKKYGVTSQHTFVQIDKEGNMIKKWSGGNTLNSVIAEIQ